MIDHKTVLQAGESYWKVRLSNRTEELSEIDVRFIPQLDGRFLIRRYEWLEDLVGSGDAGKIKEVMLVTPKGIACSEVTEPYTVFQLCRGTTDLLTGKRIKNVQIVGVVSDKDTGDCDCAIWDVQVQQLYTIKNNVKNFQAWRDGVIPIGKLNFQALDLRGIE